MWNRRSGTCGCADRPCVSAAHIYGKRRVAAEAFTSFKLTWNETLADLKRDADRHFARGVTHLVFHTYTHNPRIGLAPPGSAFGRGIGTPFMRGQSWWRHMPLFTDYAARCGELLERGKPVVDVLWYLGDDCAHKPSEKHPFPKGFKYDYCTFDALSTRAAAKDGRIDFPDGMKGGILSLGRVCGVAEVFVNGRKAATLWCEPYVCDISRLFGEMRHGWSPDACRIMAA